MVVSTVLNAVKKLSGVKDNNLLPMTQLIGVKVNDRKVTLVRNDGTNTIQTTFDSDCTEDIDVSVSANQFINLFKSLKQDMSIFMTKDNGNLVLRNNTMNFTMPAMCDETGEIKYPTIEVGEGTRFDINSFKYYYNIAKHSVDENNLTTKLRNVYFGKNTLSTNNYNLTSIKSEGLFDVPVLMPIPLCNLINECEKDEGTVTIDNLTITVSDGITTVQGKLSDEIVAYPAEAMEKFFEEEGECAFTIDTQKLVSAVNRVSVFCEDLVNKHIQLSLEDGKVELRSQKGSGREVLSVEKVERGESGKVILSTVLLQKFLKAYDTPTVTLRIGGKKILGEKNGINTLLLGVTGQVYE